VSFYQQRILPRLIHAGMRQSQLVPIRSALVGAAEGRVVEIGVGSGLNLPLYRRDVVQVIGIDPSRQLLLAARKNAAWAHCPVRLLEGQAETLPFASGSIDHVVMTWTLCSIADPVGAIGEIRRILRPGGALLFVEHGRAPATDGKIQRWQDRLTPAWKRIAGNCHLNRPIDRLIAAGGLTLARLETGYLVKGPKIATFFYQGRAVPA